MRSNIVFQAPRTIPTPPQQVFQVAATATQTGYAQGTYTIDFTVVQFTETKVCPDGSVVPVADQCTTSPIPAIGTVAIIAGIGAVAVVYAIMRRRRPHKRVEKAEKNEKKGA